MRAGVWEGPEELMQELLLRQRMELRDLTLEFETR